jgi:hypothetical protein
MHTETEDAKTPGFAIFRARDGFGLEQIMRAEPVSDIVAEGSQKVMAEGYDHGHEVKVLFALPGMSLVHLWFKSGFPLPRHTHDVDCLYYVLAGSLQIGDQELFAGDGFFIGAEAPYAYTAGEAGVEVLEFRASNDFNIRVLADNPAYWSRAAESVRGRSPAWRTERAPSSVLHQR